VYQKRIAGALERRFAHGIRKITDALEAVAVARLPVAELKPFQNVNTPEDWARYAGR
jgi:molybdopterin-guanine dinucleotide biosynthesis protein A